MLYCMDMLNTAHDGKKTVEYELTCNNMILLL